LAGTWTKTKGPKGRPGIYWQDTARGNRRYKVAHRDARGMVTSKTFDRLEDAKAFQDEQTGRRRKGDLLDASKARRTVTDLWIYFSETRETRGGRAIKPSTFASYTTRWRTHIQPRWGDHRVGDVQRDHLKRWLRELQAETSTDTRRKTQQVVHKLFAVAVSESWLARNPADGIGMPSAKVMREPQALTDEQVAKIAAEVPENYRALVWTLAETGMRIGEATALRVKNLGMPELFIKREPDDVPDPGVQKLNGGIRVVENAPEVSGVRMLGTPKSDESERVVPISPRLRQHLKAHLDGLFTNRFDPEALVFTTEYGRPVLQSNFRNRVFVPAAERAGVLDKDGKPPTVHHLRHTAISLWIARGLTPFEVSKMVGHTDLKMIERRYGHLYESELQKKIDRIGAEV
jgi:integrase